MYSTKNKLRAIVLKLAIAVVAVALLAVVGALLLKNSDNEFERTPDDERKLKNELFYEGKDYVLKKNVETFLVIGLDKFSDSGKESYNNDKQADFILLFVVDNSSEKCNVIHINRDAMVEMNVLGVAGDKIGTVTKQIALSHTYGNGKEVSCRNTANAVSKMLMGAEVDHYASITMDAVAVYNDLIGGVTLEVTDDLSSVDEALVKGEVVTLKGEQALLYVRSRYGLEDPTNNNRMRRQKQYLEALYEQSRARTEEDDGFVSKTAMYLSQFIVSDCSGNKLESLLQKISEYEFGGIVMLDGETVKGKDFMEFYPDDDSVMKIVIDCFYEIKE